MDTFSALNKLLSKLPFSIVGYHDHEKEIDSFFEQLCDSDFISKKKNIQLISYSLAKLEDLNEWKTKSYSSKVFFHALNEKYSLLILNVYYLLRKKLFGEKTHLSNDVATLLSKLFIKDVGFRLSFTEEEAWIFSYLEQNNLFSIRIPLSRVFVAPPENLTYLTNFYRVLGIFLAETIKNIHDKENEENDKGKENKNGLILDRVDGYKSTYEKIDTKLDDSILKDSFENFLQLFRPKEERELFKKELIQAILFWHKSNKVFFVNNDISETEKLIENWVELFFQIVFVSLVYNSWIEYFPAICGVHEKNQKKQLRNLGGLILGYKIDSTITQEERSIFKIISSRISSTVAGQWMHENNEKTKLQSSRENFKSLFGIFSTILDSCGDCAHARVNVDGSVVKNWEEQSKKALDFSKPFFTRREHYSNFLKTGRKTHQGLLLNLYLAENGQEFLKEKNLFYKSVSNFNNFKYEFIDIIFINNFIEILYESKNRSKKTNTLSIECLHDGNKKAGLKNIRFEISVEFVSSDSRYHFNVNDFYSNLAKRSTGSNLTAFILDNYELFRIHGDLEIKDPSENSLFLLSEGRLKSNENKKNILEIKKPSDLESSYKNLKFIIHIQHI